MTYNPTEYWQAAGADPANTEHESHFLRTDVFARQEERLMAVLETLEFGSVLEVGCGWGRITQLVSERWPDKPYTAIDLSPERVASAQRKAPKVDFEVSTIQDFNPMGKAWDLVLAVETLMHVRPSEIGSVFDKLFALSSRNVVTLDWAKSLGDVAIAPWNFLHDYILLYSDRLSGTSGRLRVLPTDLQAIFAVDMKPLHSDASTV